MTLRKFVIFTAIAALCATSALAADFRITNAKVPFAFRAGKTTMPAGNYEVETSRNSQIPMLIFRNVDSGDVRNVDSGDVTALLAPIAESPNPGASGDLARIEFLCAGTDCAFYRLWPNSVDRGMAVSRPRFRNEIRHCDRADARVRLKSFA
jgi:hypothetical protein